MQFLNFTNSQGRIAGNSHNPDPALLIAVYLGAACSQSRWFFQVPTKASLELIEASLGTWMGKDREDIVKPRMPADLLKVFQIQNH